jgi:hypothetical protein
MIKDQGEYDTGLITVLLDRFEHQRLPAVLALQKKVESGGLLNKLDLIFLKEISKNINENSLLLERHPECKNIAARMMNLCCEVMKKGLENESAS